MRFFIVIQLTSIVLSFHLSSALTCRNADWWRSLNTPNTWSTCPSSNPYLRGFYRSDPSGSNAVWLLEEGKCCTAGQGYTNQPALCRMAGHWNLTLNSNNQWALCPVGYYLNGIFISNVEHLPNIEKARCCRPHNHPDAYEDCYEEDVGVSFDRKGWSECKRDGYYMTGFYRGACDYIYYIEKFKCCNMKKAAVNGGWSTFGAWGECSSSCDAGVQERRRTCTNPPPAYGGAQCSGPNKETRECTNGPCSVDGGFTEWSMFSKCSKTCGIGEKTRTRSCTNPPPSGGGKICMGKRRETMECKIRSCKVDGGFTKWSKFSKCSKTCGKGKKTRTRSCTNPPPSGGGKICMGKRRETVECKIRSCKVDGGFTKWSKFSKCSKTCGKGKKTRTRSCTNPPPSGGGKNCKGKRRQTKECKIRPCKVDGGFTKWSKFSKCSKTCGKGKKTRTRSCTNPPPSGGGKNCKGKRRQTKECKIRPCKGLQDSAQPDNKWGLARVTGKQHL